MSRFISGYSPYPTTVAVDPCQKIAGKAVVDYDSAVACYDTFPWTKDVKRATLAALRQILPPAKLEPLKQNFTTERSFQTRATRVANGKYTVNCFSVFTFAQPFPIYAELGQGGESAFWIPKDLMHPSDQMRFWDEAGVNVTQLLGGQVVQIDNLQPELYLRQEAAFLRADLGRMMAGPKFAEGEWTLDLGLHAMKRQVPPKSRVQYTIQKGGQTHTVSVPYAAIIPLGFASGSEFYRRYCNDQATPVPALTATPLGGVLGWSPGYVPQMGPREVYLWRGQYFQASSLGKTGVLVVQEFADCEQWRDELDYAISTLEEERNIVVDLRRSAKGNEHQGSQLLEKIQSIKHESLNRHNLLKESGVVAISDLGCQGACAKVTRALPTAVFRPVPENLPNTISDEVVQHINYLSYRSGMALDPCRVWEHVATIYFQPQ